MRASRRYHQVTAERKPEFIERGYKGRYFFPHRCYYLPRALAEQHRIARRIWGLSDPEQLYCVLMYAERDAICEFPEELFFDREVMIHRDPHGMPGLVALALLYIDGDTLCCDEHQSDLVQRAGQRPEHRNKISRRFGGWHQMLLNSVLNFAVQMGLKRVRVPTARRVLSHYITRHVVPDLFERLYDRDTQMRFDAQRVGDLWEIDVEANRGRLVAMSTQQEPTATPARAACLLHDVEGAGEQIGELLEAERALGVSGTYILPPRLAGRWMLAIERGGESRAAPGASSGGHAVAFHSRAVGRYRFPRRAVEDEPAVLRGVTQAMRRIDYVARQRLGIHPGEVPSASKAINAALNRLRRATGQPAVVDTLQACRDNETYVHGYRQTPHDHAAGITDDRLRDHHFSWLIDEALPSDAGVTESGRLLRVPVTHPWPATVTDPASFAAWAQQITADANAPTDPPLLCIDLPARQIRNWLPGYREFIHALRGSAQLLSVEALADRHYLDRAL